MDKDELIRSLLLDPVFDDYAEAMAEDERSAVALGFCSLGCDCEHCNTLDEELRAGR